MPESQEQSAMKVDTNKQKVLTKKAVSPGDFDVKDHFWDSPFQNVEKETVARNIILLSRWNNNSWLEFSWEDYQKLCKHEVSNKEKEVLDGFVAEKLLSLNDGVYSVNNSFIALLENFVANKTTA